MVTVREQKELHIRSKASAADALRTALRRIIDEAKGGGHTHIIVDDIKKLQNAWEVNVKTVFTSGKRRHPEEEVGIPRGRKVFHHDFRHGKTRKDEEEEEDEKKRALDEKYRKDMEAHYAELDTIEQQRKHEAEVNAEAFNLYMDLETEHVFHEVEQEFNFAYVHFLEGTLWEEAKRDFPEVDFYMASQRDIVEAPGDPEVVYTYPKAEPRISRELEPEDNMEE